MRAYEPALASLLSANPEDDRLRALATAPDDRAETGTALWLAAEAAILANRINGRPAIPWEATKDEVEAEVARFKHRFFEILERFRQADRLAELRAMPYGQYLKSPEWQERRQAALDRAGRACQVCNGADRLDVHHRTYERRGEETDDDLTVLCRSCHGLFHEHRDLAR